MVFIVNKQHITLINEILKAGKEKNGLRNNYFFKSSNAARTAATINAENVHSLPLIAFSTSATTSLGKRIVLLMVGGVSGILNFPIVASSVSIAFVML